MATVLLTTRFGDEGGLVLTDIYLIIWLFPIIFMLHDFEEIIFIKPWFAKNRGRLAGRFPKLSARMWAHADSLSTSSLAFGIAWMFLLVSVVTVTAYLTGWYYLWFGLLLLFTLHLIIHCIPGLVLKSYAPALVTSILLLPFCCYLIASFLQVFPVDVRQAALYTVIGSIIAAVNLTFVHKAMPLLEKWLVSAQHNNRVSQ